MHVVLCVNLSREMDRTGVDLLAGAGGTGRAIVLHQLQLKRLG